MSYQAKDAYNTFHVALGTLDAQPFERLSLREQEAWAEVAGVTGWQRDRIENLEAEIREVQGLLRDRQRKLDTLKDQLAKLKA